LWKTHEDIALNERRLFNIDHCQLGAAAWPLPPALRDVIRLHHHYGAIRTDYQLLVRTIQVADLAEVRVLRGDAWRAIPEAKRPHWVGQQAGHPSWPGLPFDAKAFAARLPELSHQVAEAVDALGLGG
ncbi:MAG: hypothetical protein KC731_26355, partial [Myxococcales bacterium]|nr:hypothetical protein [Myxococcales bacterium]